MTNIVEGAAAGAKMLLRLEGGAEDALLARLAAVAVELGEAYCGVRFAAGPVEEVLTGTGAWQVLRARGVGAILEVAAVEAGTALRAGDYAIDLDAGTARVRVPAGLRVRVRCVAGLAADWETLAPPVAHGAVLLATHLFENRGAERAPPAAVAALWQPYRAMRL